MTAPQTGTGNLGTEATRTGDRRPWIIWGAGVLAYLIAVTQRTSFGVAGIAATERFDAAASALAVFTVAQLIVYAGLQIPVGVLVDRFGPRVLIVSGAALMALGQTQLAFADSLSGGIAGRLLVGGGDAMTFVAVLRLLPAWFEARRIPILTQLTGILGQLGQILSVVPFLAVLQHAGWTPAFLSAAGLGVLAAVLGITLIRDHREGEGQRQRVSLRQTGVSLNQAWKQPGTRLGLWCHFTTQFSGTVFVLIWGYPYLVSAEQQPAAVASALMTLFVVVGIVCGPLLGIYVARHPLRRSTMVLAITAATALGWLVVLTYPGPAPLWLLALLVVTVAIGGPGSMIGFDFARTFNPASRLGTATGIVNIGGFTAALLTMFAVGLILDVLLASGFSNGNLYDLASFRIAFAVQFLFLAVGTVAILVLRRRVRAQLARQSVVVPPLRQAIAREIRRRREARK
ncbi:MFS transporter [Arthrobacter sp. JZ12]|uniref:MFS transporter n=1 Tax=Arthrobacter sp. JZ12 TaxID=2654190 RepID=UPI002B4A4C90|nr:MFS transporter [Arthrobacter sp. JZ12]WRH24761.1 MFS transporter [Arthrobacter sp. JZ12]